MNDITLSWKLRSMRRIDPGFQVDVTVLYLTNMMISPDLPGSAGKVLWCSRRPRKAIVHAALKAAQTVLDEHGE